MTRLPGQPIFAAADGSLEIHGVVDLLDDTLTSSPWAPSNELASGIVAGVEACKDIAFFSERFGEEAHRRRTIKAMTVPLCALMDVLKDLMAGFNAPRWRELRQSWVDYDQRCYLDISKRLKKEHMGGPVRKVRNVLGAHLDPEARQGGIHLSAADLFGALGDSLILLMLMLKHRSAFQWIRGLGALEGGEGRVVDTIAEWPICLRWITDMEGHPKDVGYIRLVANPVDELKHTIRETVQAYNKMVVTAQLPMRKIIEVSTDALITDPTLASKIANKPR